MRCSRKRSISDDFNRINELLAVWFDQAQSIREMETDKPPPAGKPRRVFSFYGSTFALKQRAQARPLRSSHRAATSHSVRQSLDTNLQISLFGKLKLTNCARPGNRAGFFMPASCGRSQNSQQDGTHVRRIGLQEEKAEIRPAAGRGQQGHHSRRSHVPGEGEAMRYPPRIAPPRAPPLVLFPVVNKPTSDGAMHFCLVTCRSARRRRAIRGGPPSDAPNRSRIFRTAGAAKPGSEWAPIPEIFDRRAGTFSSSSDW